MTSQQEVLFEVDNQVGWIILNRPKALNALSLGMVKSIYQQLKEWENDEAVRLICMKSKLEKAFCSGGDVRALREQSISGDKTFAEEYFSTEYRMDMLVHEYSKPVLVYMNGIVMGGGIGMAAGSSFKIVTEKTKWAMPEQNIGLFPDVGASYFLNKFPREIALYLALTASVIHAKDLLDINGADYYINSERWTELEEKIKTRDWKSDDVEGQLQRLIQDVSQKDESLTGVLNLKKIKEHFGFDTVEEIVDSLASATAAGDDWAEEMRNTLLKKSPTSLKVTMEQIKRGKAKTMRECFEMELEMAIEFMDQHDFFEGVRAVLVDKDHAPNWHPKELSEVSDTYVEKYFSEHWPKGNPLSSKPAAAE